MHEFHHGGWKLDAREFMRDWLDVGAIGQSTGVRLCGDWDRHDAGDDDEGAEFYARVKNVNFATRFVLGGDGGERKN